MTVELANPAISIPITLTNGVELSNLGALDDGQLRHPLNTAAGAPLIQTTTVSIDKNGIEDAFGFVRDVGLWLEFKLPA